MPHTNLFVWGHQNQTILRHAERVDIALQQYEQAKLNWNAAYLAFLDACYGVHGDCVAALETLQEADTAYNKAQLRALSEASILGLSLYGNSATGLPPTTPEELILEGAHTTIDQLIEIRNALRKQIDN